MPQKKYTKPANRSTPGLIIFLIDISATMASVMGEKTRKEIVTESLHASYKQMVSFSNKGINIVSPRYRIAFVPYSEKAFWYKEKIFTITDLVEIGIPIFSLRNETNTYAAFKKAEEILSAEHNKIMHHPAPIVCHITDGKYTGKNPLPVAKRIKKMSVNDGNVLIENIFISDKLLTKPISSIKKWKGITNETQFADPYAKTLRDMSSPIPESYRSNINNDNGFHLSKDALLMIPGTSQELVKLGFMIASATPRTLAKDY